MLLNKTKDEGNWNRKRKRGGRKRRGRWEWVFLSCCGRTVFAEAPISFSVLWSNMFFLPPQFSCGIVVVEVSRMHPSSFPLRFFFCYPCHLLWFQTDTSALMRDRSKEARNKMNAIIKKEKSVKTKLPKVVAWFNWGLFCFDQFPIFQYMNVFMVYLASVVVVFISLFSICSCPSCHFLLGCFFFYFPPFLGRSQCRSELLGLLNRWAEQNDGEPFIWNGLEMLFWYV